MMADTHEDHREEASEKSHKDSCTIEQEAPKLKRNLGLLNIVALLVSITGHVSVFITPGAILAASGSVGSTLVIYCIGTFIVYSLALCFAELGTIFQAAGGPYIYLTLTFGNIYGFLFAWGYIILISGPFLAFASQTAALYIIKAAFPYFDCQSSVFDISVILMAGFLLCGLFYLNCFHLKLLINIQSILTMSKMLAIAIIIISGVFYEFTNESNANFDQPFKDSVTEPGSLSMALLYVIFSNGGWQAVTSLTEETKNPAKTLPRSIHITFAINTVLILMMYIAYMFVLDKNEIIATSAVAILFCKRVHPALVPVVSCLVALASVGALNTGLMGHSRVLFAAARKGDMPSILGTLHPTYRTPMASLFVVTVYGACMQFSGGMTIIMQFIGLFSLIMGLKMVAALLYLRVTQPKLHRPYKAPTLFPILQVVVSVCLLILLVVQEPAAMLTGSLIYFAGVPLYLVCVVWTNKPAAVPALMCSVTSLLQKVFLLTPG